MIEGEPEYRIQRKEIYNPHFEDYVKEELPTNPISRANRITGVNIGTLIASHDTGVGSYLVVTRFNFIADRETEFCITDRTGTVKFVYLEAAGMHTEIGEMNAPVLVLKGTCNFRSLIGTSAGTYCCSFAGNAPQFGTETVS